MATMHRCIIYMTGDESGFANAMMNDLLDNKPATVLAELQDLDTMSFTDMTDEESFIPVEFEIYETGDYRLGWDSDPKGEDALILEKIYETNSRLTVGSLREVDCEEFSTTLWQRPVATQSQEGK